MKATKHTLTTECYKLNQQDRDAVKEHFGVSTAALREGVPEPIGQNTVDYIKNFAY